jgi:RHH-type proline utilization regulon transcriptional repressor/proline dehydrogenase/delta 1-pyrroline-5-carboxylate dehydrogenase
MESIVIGPAEDPGSFMGPVIDAEALRKIRGYMEIGSNEATPILVREAKANGFYVGPVLIADVKPDSRLAQEEIFGPVVALMKADTIDEALDIANSTAQALTGGDLFEKPREHRESRARIHGRQSLHQS